MQIEQGKFYFIKDEFFDLVKDKELCANKERGTKRPCFYCFKDSKYQNLIWFIPISSKLEKYIKQNRDVVVNERLNKELQIKANKILKLVEKGYYVCTKGADSINYITPLTEWFKKR